MANAGLFLQDDRPQFRWPCSLDLTHAGSFMSNSECTIQFDLCITDPGRFGFVLHGGLDDSTELSLAYANHFSQDTASLVLAIDGEPVSLRLLMPKASLHPGAWHAVSLRFDPQAQRVIASLDAQEMSAHSQKIPRNLELRLVFGSISKSGEIPCMGLRNVRYLEREAGEDTLKAYHHWPLGELEGDEAGDVIGSRPGLVRHGTWLAESHIGWQLLTSIPAKNGISFFSDYDPKTGTIFFAGIDSLIEYATRTGELRKIVYQSPRAMVAGQINFDSDRRLLYGHHPGGGEVSAFDSKSRTWSVIDTSVGMQGQYNHHPSFVDPVSGDLYSIGGYGWYTVKNHLCRYSFQTRQWEVVPTNGDSLEPRSGIALCETSLPGIYYFCGGEGNASGRQDAGWRYFFDLWKLDLQKREITNLWRAPHTTVSDRIIALANAGTDGHDDLYALFGPSVNEIGSLQLYQISSVLSGRTVVAEAPEFTAGWWPSLYFDRPYQRFLLVVPTMDKGTYADVKVYSLAYPPMRRSDFARTDHSASRTLPIVVGAVLVIASIGFGYRYARKRSGVASQDVTREISTPEPETDGPCISVFGGFKVIDSSGTNITEQFSLRLRQVFLLLLLRTNYDTGSGADGVGATELADLLWPGCSPASAKDSRGVAIAALRKLLACIGDISIELNNKKYRVRIGRDVECDYLRFRRAMHAVTSENGSSSLIAWPELLKLCGTGALLPELSLPWLDAIKADVFTKFEHVASARLQSAEEQSEEGVLKIAEVLLLWDPINELALRSKLRALWKDGRHGAARIAYDQFSSNYASLYGKPYALPFNSILSNND